MRKDPTESLTLAGEMAEFEYVSPQLEAFSRMACSIAKTALCLSDQWAQIL